MRFYRPLLRIVHRGYKMCISPLLGNACRFHPSCSDYTLDAIETHGLMKGILLALHRIVRCNPWCAGGHDPVPGQKSEDLPWDETREALIKSFGGGGAATANTHPIRSAQFSAVAAPRPPQKMDKASRETLVQCLPNNKSRTAHS